MKNIASKNFDIVTFGSAVIDTFVDTEFNKKTRSFNYPAGEKILVHNMRSDIGGGATNSAVAFARFGFKTGCISKIGDDIEGKDILELLKKEKVKFLGTLSNKERTGHSIILDSKEKSRTILTYKGPGNNIRLSEIPVFKTSWLYFTGVVGQSFNTQVSIAKKFKRQGAKIAFNPGYIKSSNNLKPLLEITDILVVNKEEAIALQRKYKKRGNLLEALRKLGPKIVVYTDKNKKAYSFDGVRKYGILPHNVKVVERTGAGDAFGAGFVAGIMANKPLNECMKLALSEGESVLQHFGAKNNLLKRRLK